MNDLPLQPRIDAATAYEESFVPALFGAWAPRVASAAGLRPGQRVLDVACGTGVLAREAALRVAPGGSVVGLDPDPGMLAVAERVAPQIEWRRGAAEALPYPAGSFDAVVSQFGLMFFADRVGALREMLRVLAPGGRLAVAVWDGLERVPAYAAEVELVGRLAGEPAAAALRMPFALGPRAGLADLFVAAGVAGVAVYTAPGTASFPSIRWMVEADLRGWLPLVGVELPEEVIRRILSEADDALGPHVRATGGIEFDLSAHVVTGRKP